MTGYLYSPSDIKKEVFACFQHLGPLLPIIDRIERPRYRWERFSALREFYGRADLELLDPYAVNWTAVFTPIEALFWQDIRCLGLSMWPQYPVGRFFIDFADVENRIGIECDGKGHNPKHDKERDRELEKLGWTIYRIGGRDCFHEKKGERLLCEIYGIRFGEEDEDAE